MFIILILYSSFQSESKTYTWYNKNFRKKKHGLNTKSTKTVKQYLFDCYTYNCFGGKTVFSKQYNSHGSNARN